jgi:anti-anti-sigma factor
MNPSQPFSVRSERHGRVHRLKPLGELDIATGPILREAFDAAFSDGDAEMIVVDLTELEFIDSTGIHLLLHMNSVCEHADRLRVINGSPAVVRVLDVTGVRTLLPIVSSDDDPLTPCRQRESEQ